MADGRILVFAADVRGLPEIPDTRLPELFPDRRAEKLRKFRMPEDRIRSAWAELLLRLMLEKFCGIPRTAQCLSRMEHGKPYVTVPASSAGAVCAAGCVPEVSISHSGPWAAVSLEPEPHGVDVEVRREDRMIRSIADRWFLPAEAEAVRNAPEAERAELFLRFWTVKESFLKMTGEGLSAGPQTADALRLLSEDGGETAARCMRLPDGAVLSFCGPGTLLPESAEILSGEVLRKAYGQCV